jgi:hypothetical protein
MSRSLAENVCGEAVAPWTTISSRKKLVDKGQETAESGWSYNSPKDVEERTKSRQGVSFIEGFRRTARGPRGSSQCRRQPCTARDRRLIGHSPRSQTPSSQLRLGPPITDLSKCHRHGERAKVGASASALPIKTASRASSGREPSEPQLAISPSGLKPSTSIGKSSFFTPYHATLRIYADAPRQRLALKAEFI